MVNWDPAALTALSDEEVIHKEVDSRLFHVRYKVAGTEDEWLTIATTRPETILGDSAICINPDDERYTHLHGKKAIVPMANREVPIIFDTYVEMDFGTGALKVTPAHDMNDYDIGQRHKLETIDVFNANGTMSEAAGFYIGEDRFVVRKQIAKDLDAAGHMVEIENYKNKVGFSERTDVPIEPRLSLQWWVDMKAISEPALKAVEEKDVLFHPDKFVNTYRHWMENIKDWCISRQLWWGHRIPAFFYGEGPEDFVVAKTAEEALKKAQEKSGNTGLTAVDVRQEEDVLDTWFSSWLWPISVFNGFYSKEEVDYYYPTNDLVTAPEIMFFWVARMIMAGYEYKGEKPFKNVYYTGIVRDDKGRKMSKSLGNSPDPIDLMKEYGADGVRVGMLLTSPAGNDLPFDVKLCDQGKKFANKIWNSMRLIKGWEVVDTEPSASAAVANDWIRSRFNQVLAEMNAGYDQFRISEVLMSAYKLVWNDYCSWYLEMIKPEYGKPIDRQTLTVALDVLEDLLKVLHPFMPFITEEIWHFVRERKGPEEALVITSWPEVGAQDEQLLKDFEDFSELVTQVRNVRATKNISFKNPIDLKFKENETRSNKFDASVSRLCNLTSFEKTSDKVEQSFSFMVRSNEFFIPMGENIDTEGEKKKLEEELKRAKGLLIGVEKKLSNEKFMAGAPEQVVAMEKKKQADANAKIKVIEEKLASLG